MQVYPAHPTQAKPPPGAPPATFEELTADLAGVPDGLCAATRWLLWRYEWRPAEGKWTKVPISAETGRPADGTPPDTGLTLYDALAQAERLRDKEVTVSGVGIALGDGLAGVDLDKCLEAGALAPWAQAVVDRLGSWAEESVSATGVHILCAGALPPGRRRTGQIEMYDAGRFFTVTGRQLAGTPVTVQERTAELGAWHAEVFPPAPAAPERPASPLGDDDESVLRRCRDNRKTGAHFDRLWNGDLSDHGGDESAADLALCNYLRFYSGDRGQVERLWGNSALGRRDKWQRQDYRAWTLDKAMRGDVYTPPPPVGTNGRAHPAPAADPVTLAQVVATFQQWLYLEDLGPVYAALAAVAANRMAGDPVWLRIVGA
jgi:primase-polymerase (primpol)-like protein